MAAQVIPFASLKRRRVRFTAPQDKRASLEQFMTDLQVLINEDSVTFRMLARQAHNRADVIRKTMSQTS